MRGLHKPPPKKKKKQATPADSEWVVGLKYPSWWLGIYAIGNITNFVISFLLYLPCELTKTETENVQLISHWLRSNAWMVQPGLPDWATYRPVGLLSGRCCRPKLQNHGDTFRATSWIACCRLFKYVGTTRISDTFHMLLARLCRKIWQPGFHCWFQSKPGRGCQDALPAWRFFFL